MLQIRADDGRRIFRAQSHAAAAAVIEGVHFFRNDVGRFADAAQKQFGTFKQRGTNFAEPVKRTDLTDFLL